MRTCQIVTYSDMLQCKCVEERQERRESRDNRLCAGDSVPLQPFAEVYQRLHGAGGPFCVENRVHENRYLGH